jgi:two-component system sensor histidine kinase BarA
VLVADDSPVNREVAIEALAQLGVAADVAEDGKQAVAQTADRAYDLVLMDGSMPVMDGFTAARRIRDRERDDAAPRLPIVALTAHVVGAAADAWREAGMDGVLHKPFTLAELEACLAAFAPATMQADASAPPPASATAPAEAAAEPADEAALFTAEKVREFQDHIAAGRGEFVARVLRLYEEHGPAAAADLAAAFARGDFEALGKAAHALKSMSLNIGAARVAAEAAALEKAARQGSLDDGGSAIASLQAVLAQTIAAAVGLAGAPLDGAGAVVAEAGSHARPRGSGGDELEGELRRAIDNDEIEVAFQPQVDRTAATITGAEALARWTRRCGESVPPSRFIPIAEQSGLVARLGEQVLRRACVEAARWPGLKIDVNLSAVQLVQPDLPERVEAILRQTGTEPGRLELELTESALIASADVALRNMERLREIGVTFALDDFGTGYSSLTYLRQLPLATIKIDQSFVARCHRITEATIVHAVVSIGRALGMKVIAEGVETEDQRRFLAAAGVHALQGYLFFRPLAPAALDEALAAPGLAKAPPHRPELKPVRMG